MLQARKKYIGVLCWITFLLMNCAYSIQAQSLDKTGLIDFSIEFIDEQALSKEKLNPNQKRKAIYWFKQFPVIYESANKEGAEAVKNNQVWADGIAGLSLSGSDQIIGYWDKDRPRLTHQEYISRAIFKDVEVGSNDSHATQMTGTMIASGIMENAHGMADKARVEAYNWNNDISEMATAATDDLLISAHPYAETAGWTNTSSYCGNDLEWVWFSLENEDSTKAFQFGYYDTQAKNWDSVAYMAPDYLIVKAAGNFRGRGPEEQPIKHYTLDSDFNCIVDSTTVREINGGLSGFETINGSAVSKNVLVVGAVESSSNDFSHLSSIAPINSSGFGPADDGRIKPDIVAPTNLYTTGGASDTDYSTSGGTSAATAVVTGSTALLQEHYQNLTNDTLSSASLRALIAHSAEDLGNAGPDYRTGWGLLNTERAARFLSSNLANQHKTVFKDTVLVNGGSITLSYLNTSSKPLKVTIAWTDPAGTEPDSGDDPSDITLVNDLDIRVLSPSSTTFFPWKLSRLSPGADAIKADNVVDNIEQVHIPESESGAYTITVSHKGNLQSGSQRFSVLVSEAEPVIEYETIMNGSWSNTGIWRDGNIPKTSFHEAVIHHEISLDTDLSISGFDFTNISSELILNGNEVEISNGMSGISGGGFSGDTSASVHIKGWNSDSLFFFSEKEKLKNLVIDAPNDTIALGSDLSVYSSLHLRSGVLKNGSFEIRLVADSIQAALLKKTNGELVGNLTYSRWFGNGGTGWRMISSPVQNETFSTLRDSFFTQGGIWAEYPSDSVNSSLWLFNTENQNFDPFRNADDFFASGSGYLFYMFENDENGTAILPAYLEMKGLEPDSVLVDLYRGEEDSLSYNLVGNPFAGNIDWHLLYDGGINIGGSYAVWDPESSAYKYYNRNAEIGDAGRYIAPMQGFFVQTTGENPKLNFSQSQKTSDSLRLFGKVKKQDWASVGFILKNSKEKILDKETQLLITTKHDQQIKQIDTRRISALDGKENNISFLNHLNEKFVFQGKELNENALVVPLVITVSEPGFYSMGVEKGFIPEDISIWIEDPVTGKQISERDLKSILFQGGNLQKEYLLFIAKNNSEDGGLVGELPSAFRLKQNYPNPFNPSTLIEYDIPESSFVEIEVFDLIGRKVQSLVNERKTPGFYSVEFDASNLASGTYFYRLTSGDFVQFKKMLLIK